MFETREIDFKFFSEKIDINLTQKLTFAFEEDNQEGEFGTVYKGILVYNYNLNNTSILTLNNTANKITMSNSKDTHLFYCSLSCNEDNIALEIHKFDCSSLLEERICSIHFDKERYNEFLNFSSRSYIYNLDGRHILLKVLNDIILDDSTEKIFYNTGNKYELLFNSFIDTFRNDGLDYIYIQNGKYSWKDKKQHLDSLGGNYEIFKKY